MGDANALMEEIDEMSSALEDGGSSDEPTDNLGSEQSAETGESPEVEVSGEAETPSASGDEDGGEEGEEVQSETENENLKAELETLKAEMTKLRENKPDETETSDETPSAPVDADSLLTPIDMDFDPFEGKDPEQLLDNPTEFSSWFKETLGKVFKSGQQVAFDKLKEYSSANIDRKLTYKEKADEFYTTHSDLKDHRGEVARAAKLVASANPNLSTDELFTETAKYARYRLNLPEPKGGEEQEPDKKPTKPALNNKSSKSKSRKTSEPELAGQDKEIADMLQYVEQN